MPDTGAGHDAPSWPPGRWIGLLCVPLGLWLIVGGLATAWWLAIAAGVITVLFGVEAVRR